MLESMLAIHVHELLANKQANANRRGSILTLALALGRPCRANLLLILFL